MYVKCDKLISINPQQFFENKEIYLEGAQKVVSLRSRARVISVEELSGEVKLNYRLTITAVYLTSAEALDFKEESYDLTTTLKNHLLTPQSNVLAEVNVIGVEYVGQSNVKVRVYLEASGKFILACGYKNVEAEGGLIVKQSAQKVECVKPFSTAEIVVENNVEPKEFISDIISTDTDITIKSVSTATDICEISGEAQTYLTYVSGNELCSTIITTPFERELLSEGITDIDQAYLKAIANTINVTLNEEDGTQSLMLEIVMDVSGYTIRNEEAIFIADCYSKDSELKVKLAHAELTENVCRTVSMQKFSGSVSLDDGPEGKSIVCLGTPFVSATNVSISDGINVEGVISVELVYRSEQNTLERLLAEVPYKFNFKGDFDCSGDLCAKVVVKEISGRMRYGYVELMGEACVELNGTKIKEVKFVEDVEVVAPREVNDAVISVYLVGESETLFDVAKALASTEEELIELNPEINLPIKKGDKILMYRPL